MSTETTSSPFLRRPNAAIRTFLFWVWLLGAIPGLASSESDVPNTTRRLVFIDSGLSDAHVLKQGAIAGSRVVLMKSGLDVQSQIQASLSQARFEGLKLESIDFVTHGSSGRWDLANEVITAESVDQLSGSMAGIKDVLETNGSIRLYGCAIAADEKGQSFVRQLSKVLQVPVLASTDATGSPRLGGNWDLEFSTSPSTTLTVPPFTAAAQLGFGNLLALSAGDIVVLRVEDNGNATAQIKWAPLVDIPSGTSFVITDRSWINGAAFFPILTTEGYVTITATATITAGQVFTLNLSMPSATTLTRDSDGSSSFASFSVTGWSGNTFTFTTAGDNVFIYTGADTSPSFLFGLLFTGVTVNRDATTGWSTSTTVTTTSLLPSGLTSGSTALAMNNSGSTVRFVAYSGSTTTATRDTWLSRIGNSANWTFQTTTFTGTHGTQLSFPAPNTSPTFVGSTTTLSVNENASATSIANLLHVSDTDSSQTLTWSQSSAPSHGSLSFSSATASSGSSDVTPGGSITYTPTSGYIGSDSFDVQVSDGTSSATRTINVTVNDVTNPTISIGSPSASITASGSVTYTVTYSDAHFSSSTLAEGNITVNATGNASVGSIQVTGTGTTRTVTLSSITGDGAVGISISSGTATDTTGNFAGAAGPSTTFTVDNTGPVVSIGSPSTSITKSGPVRFTVTFSDSNLNSISLLASQIGLNTTGDVQVNSIGVSGSGSTRTVTLSSITGNGTVGISIPSGKASDTAGNSAGSAGPSSTSTVDNTAPQVDISSPSVSATRSGPVTYTITYSDSNFNASTLATGNISLNKTGTADGTISSVTGSGTTRTVTVSSITGDGTLGISVESGTATDDASNSAGAAGPSATFSTDNTAPAVDSIHRQTPSGASTTNNTVVFRVSFSEGVSNVDTSDFGVTTTASASGTIASVSASTGSTIDVTVNGITGTGTLRLDLNSTGTGIQDAVGNPVSGGFTSGQTYSVSPPNAAPVISTSVGTTAFIEAANATSTPVAIDPDVTVSDTDSSTLSSARVFIGTNYHSSEDVLSFTNDGSTMGNISASFDSSSGELSLSSSGSTATLSEWQAALRAVLYSNTSNEPNTSNRTMVWEVSDGTDSSSTADKTVSVTATNDAPESIALSSSSISENQASGTTVGTLSATDPDTSDTASFSLVSGAGSTNNGSFTIDGNALKTAESFNYEVKTSYTIRVRATDSHLATFEQAFTITISNVNEAPSFSGYSFNATKDTATTVLLAKILAKSSDPEGAPRSITAYDSVSAQGGTVELLSGSFRYTPPTSYVGADSFGLSITDGNSTITGAVSVTVTAPSSGSGQSFVASGLSGSDVNLKFAGIPGRSYQIQHTTSLPPTASWTPLATVTANSSGFVIYTHLSPPSPSYWRTQLVP